MKKNILKNTYILLSYVNRYSPGYIWVMLFVSITAFTGPYSTVLVPKTIVDMLIKQSDIRRILLVICTMVVANVVRIVTLTIFEERYKPCRQMEIEKGINALLMDKSRVIDLKRYDDPEFRDIYDRAITLANSGVSSFLDAITNLVDRFFYLTSVIAIITSLDSCLIIFSLCCMFVLFFFQRIMTSYAYQTDVLVTRDRRRAEYSKKLCYGADYVSDVKILKLEQIFKNEYLEANGKWQDIVRKRSVFKGVLRISDETLRFFILNVVTMIYLVVRIQAGHLSVSSFVVLITATMQLSYELFSFVNSLNSFYRLGIYTEDLVNVLECESEVERIGVGKRLEILDSLSFIGVSFAYPQKEQFVLKNVNIKIFKGQRIAVVGHNGAGKTTLIRLLLRLYDVCEGTITVNSENIQAVELDSYRNQIGVVFQDYHYYAMTIAENVLMRKVEGNEDEELVQWALKKADLWEYVNGLPEKINTVLTREFNDKGLNMSGGQSQKLALARVFAQKNKQMLIMDEVSAALDPYSENKINKSVLDFCRDKILIFISHRLSLMKEMNYIYYFEHGEVKEQGTHETLMNENGGYARMYKLQAEAYGDSATGSQ